MHPFGGGTEAAATLVGGGLPLAFEVRFPADGHNTPVGANREKAIPAGRAAIGGHMKRTEKPCHPGHPVLAGNALKIHVPAFSAVHKPDVTDRN
jgi:hypothetical protein